MSRALAIILSWWLWTGPASADSPAIAVIYPQLPDPYRTIFAEIVSGIHSGTQLEVKEYTLNKQSQPGTLQEWLNTGRYGALIVLGQRALELVKAANPKVPIIAGAVKIVPAHNPGVSAINLTAAPDRLFDLLQRLTPRTQRVHVIYDPAQQDWLIALGKQAAAERGLELVRHEAQDLHSIAQRYNELFASHPGPGDALWLPTEDNAGQEVLLTEVLEQLWRHGWPAFSSNPVLVKRGMLFALYPDNRTMGISLGKLATQRTTEHSEAVTVLPATDLLSAINLRTAEHLNLPIKAEQRQDFDLVFPE